ncbi:MAG: WxcM-like domain-containing protein [Muribaculaceae bacterium]|jgi:oxalate decarboxylase/phosphoglucose isomerase-like protein (cupin superfamily)|nr:WxcM-like domain-containing protein [Muribaculaceae bacterium]
MESKDRQVPHLIELPKINDPRGNLTFIESGQHVPFEVKRNYWIYDVPSGMWRDGHAFKTQEEFIVALSGSFDVVVNDGNGEQVFHLSRPQIGLYVPKMTWRHIDNFSTNSVALVLANTAYDAADYIEVFDEYMTLKKQDNGKD